MEYLSLYTSTPTIHWEYNTSFISVVAAEIVTPIVKHIDIPDFFLQGKAYNIIFVQKYENSSGIPEDMCTKT